MRRQPERPKTLQRDRDYTQREQKEYDAPTEDATAHDHVAQEAREPTTEEATTDAKATTTEEATAQDNARTEEECKTTEETTTTEQAKEP